jgi:hypothetical protein
METQASVPPGYDEKEPIGRPKEKSSIIGTQRDPLGKDRLGKKENGMLYTANKSEESGTPKGGSPLALAELNKNRALLESLSSLRKEIVFDSALKFDLLSEENIKNI